MRYQLTLALLAACASPTVPTTDAGAAGAGTVLTDAQPAPDARQGKALVLLLHGSGGNGPATALSWGADAVADRVIVLAPSSSYRNWNASNSCCDGHLDHDDDGLLASLVTARIALGDVDPSRVYVMGHSNGAFMAWRLLCNHADVFRGGVMLEGAANSATDAPCLPSRPIRVLHVHGDVDSTVGYARGAHVSSMPDAEAPAIGPLGSTDQESVAADCTGVLRAGGKVDSGIAANPPSLVPPDVDGFTRDCAGRADLWRSNGGVHSPTLGPTWFSHVLDWADGSAP